MTGPSQQEGGRGRNRDSEGHDRSLQAVRRRIPEEGAQPPLLRPPQSCLKERLKGLRADTLSGALASGPSSWHSHLVKDSLTRREDLYPTLVPPGEDNRRETRDRPGTAQRAPEWDPDPADPRLQEARAHPQTRPPDLPGYLQLPPHAVACGPSLHCRL